MNNDNKHHPQNFFSGKLTINKIRKAVQGEVKPDLNGDINFRIGPDGRWLPFDERDFWLSGKPIGGLK